jgi:hypothetical protein
MTRQDKALKIAEYEGWELLKNGLYQNDDKTKHKSQVQQFKDEVIRKYIDYNGLMPIVERVNKIWCNNPDGFEITSFEINVFVAGTHTHFESDRYESLIDQLQDAILFYHENKEGGK